MKRALIITYYWPPGGGAGVQRWLKFTKYLPSYGWQPVVMVPENPEYPVLDTSLISQVAPGTEVLKSRIWEPAAYYKKMSGKSNELTISLSSKGHKSLKDRLMLFIRTNFFLPDARLFWIRPCYRQLVDYIRKSPPDVLVTTGPPHSVHLIGLKLKKTFPDIPWVADFRDPWTKIEYYGEVFHAFWAHWLHHRWEKAVVTRADAVVTIGDDISREFKEIGGTRVLTITNGYDPEDFPESRAPRHEKFTVTYVGNMVGSRNPHTFWRALDGCLSSGVIDRKAIHVKLIGKIDQSIRNSIRENGLEDVVEECGYLDHEKAVKEQQAAHLLLLIINNVSSAKGIVTGKLFEYMASGSPILLIGPVDGEASMILGGVDGGVACDHSDETGLRNALQIYFEKYKSGRLTGGDPSRIMKYSRKTLTADLAACLSSLTDRKRDQASRDHQIKE